MLTGYLVRPVEPMDVFLNGGTMKTLYMPLALAFALIPMACNEGTVEEADAAVAPEVETSPAFQDALASDAETLESKVMGLANALDAEQYDWRPGDEVLSAGEVFMHIAAYNYFYPSMAGAEIPAGVGVTTDYSTVSAFEASRTERAEIIEALSASFEHLRGAVAAAPADGMDAEVEVFGQSSTVQEAWYGTMTHIHEHLGQLIAYARTNGVTPPWSM